MGRKRALEDQWNIDFVVLFVDFFIYIKYSSPWKKTNLSPFSPAKELT